MPPRLPFQPLLRQVLHAPGVGSVGYYVLNISHRSSLAHQWIELRATAPQHFSSVPLSLNHHLQNPDREQALIFQVLRLLLLRQIWLHVLYGQIGIAMLGLLPIQLPGIRSSGAIRHLPLGHHQIRAHETIAWMTKTCSLPVKNLPLY